MLEFKVPCHVTVFQHCEAEEIIVDFNNGWSASIIAQPAPEWRQEPGADPLFELSVHYDCDDMPCGEVMRDLTKAEVEDEIATIGICPPPGSITYDFEALEFSPTMVEGEFYYA